MMKFFGRRRSRSRTHRRTSSSLSSLRQERESSFMTTSSRTGGYEVSRESDFQSGEEDTILDQSLYTTTDHTYHSLLEKSTVISTATTIKQSTGAMQERLRRCPQKRPVLDTGDIGPCLELYQRNRQEKSRYHRIVPTTATSICSDMAVVVTPESDSATRREQQRQQQQQQFYPNQDSNDAKQHSMVTPRWGNTASNRQQGTEQQPSSSFDNPQALSLLVADHTDSTEDSTIDRIQKIEPAPYRFEFAAMEEIPTRKKMNGDEEENASVHSFSFSQTEEEIGFEVDDPYPIFNHHQASTAEDHDNEDDKDEDRDSIPSQPSVDVTSRLNMTDSELLDGRSSPGALRLTAEGLKQHERKTFTEARRRPERHADELEAWRKEHETRKWYRKKLKEREQKLLDRTMQLRESQHIIPENEPVKRCSPSFRSENDVAELSLAPLAAMQHLSLGKNNNNTAPKRRSFQLFRKKGKPTAQELLDRERQRAREAKRLEEYQQRQERERIARKRNEYLEQQRAKEIITGEALLRTTSGGDDTNPTTTTLSSLSTATPNNNMPYCVLCLEDVRTHIATPCMHFSFCASCVEKLEASDKNECPVCRQPNVSYACCQC